jgi:hypothetical protein
MSSALDQAGKSTARSQEWNSSSSWRIFIELLGRRIFLKSFDAI